MVTLKVFNPCGLPPRHEFAHAPRLADLNGKTIGEISSGFWQYDRAFPLIRQLLKERFPGVTFVPYTDLPNGSHAIDVDNIGEVVAAMGCDAAIGGPSGSGSNAMTVGRSLARIEKKGIPTFSIITTGHAGVAKTAFLGMGFSEAASCYEFPARTFLPGSDLADLAGNIDKVVDGLTTWKPPANGAAGCSLDMVAVSGRDYREASDRVNSLFLTNNWGDGLPLLPPTEERVEWVLCGTGLPRNTNIGKVLTRGGLA
ncbi:MAG: hypothetical protein HYY32_00275, partial [Chloroflexi bacterium]|nr:hypothetical protein [Chloroflexota bacterium]